MRSRQSRLCSERNERYKHVLLDRLTSFAHHFVYVAVGEVDAVRLSVPALAKLAVFVSLRQPSAVVVACPSKVKPYQTAVIVQDDVAIIVKYDVPVLPEQFVAALVVSGLSEVLLSHFDLLFQEAVYGIPIAPLINI